MVYRRYRAGAMMSSGFMFLRFIFLIRPHMISRGGGTQGCGIRDGTDGVRATDFRPPAKMPAHEAEIYVFWVAFLRLLAKTMFRHGETGDLKPSGNTAHARHRADPSEGAWNVISWLPELNAIL